MQIRIFGFMLVLILVLTTGCVFAQDVTVAAVSPAVNPAVSVTSDNEILKRTPIIDGIVENGEWDGFYQFVSGDWEAKTYINWDDRNIYVAAISNKPIDFLALIDGNDDGWFHGEDNYEIRAMRSADGETLDKSVLRYESRSSISPIAIPVTSVENAMVEMKSAKSGTSFMIEMKVPMQLIRGLSLRGNKKIGIQVAVKQDSSDDSWVPNKVQGEHRECSHCTLVTQKYAKLQPLDLAFDLKYGEIARGEEITGKFHVTNRGKDFVDVRSVVIAGEGKSAEFLNSQKLRVDGLSAGKHMAFEMKSTIPLEMPIGTWVMGAEVKSGDTKLGAGLVSFDVVDAYDVSLKLPASPVSINAKELVFGVVIKNNMRKALKGTAKITLPIGWQLSRSSNDFYILGRDTLRNLTFRTKAPLGAFGDIPVKVEITANGITRTVESSFKMETPK